MMIGSSTFRSCLAVLMWSLCALSARAAGPLEPRLQWFDSNGELLELDWPASIQWTWTDERESSLEAQVWIEVPERLNLSVGESTQLKLLKGAASGGNSHQLLIAMMHGPKLTAQLTKQESEAEAPQRAALVVTLIGESPKVVVDESCVAEGVGLRSRKAGPGFLFIAARCRPSKRFVDVAISTSEDAFPFDEPLKAPPAEGATKPVVLRIPRKAWKSVSPGGVLGTVSVATQPGPVNPTRFDVIYARGLGPQPQVPVARVTPKASAAKAAEKKRPAPGFALGLSLSHLDYTVVGGTSGVPPSEYNLDLSARHEREVLGTPLQLEAALPVVSFMPSFFHLPASGFYEAAARAPIAVTTGSELTVRLDPGFKLGAIHLAQRSSESGFYIGPQLLAELNGRGYEARLGVGPLAGHGGFNSFELSSELAWQAVKAEEERRWDLVLKVDYLKLGSQGAQAAELTKASLGVRVWY